MEKKQQKISAYNKIRRGFYKSVDEIEKAHRKKIIWLALGTLFLASTLLFCAALLQNSTKGQYVYYYGDIEQKIAADGDVHTIDFIALADYCGMEKNVGANVATFSLNGTKAIFENGSDIAKINGINVKMPSKAAIKNGYCLVPLSTVKSIFNGLAIEVDKNKTTVTLAEKDVYMIVDNFSIKYETDLSSYHEYINSTNSYIYTLLNKQNPIDNDFTPSNLVEIPEKYLHSYKHGKGIELEATTLKALEAMIQDMNALGITDVYVQSAYRTYAYQNMLFNNYIDGEMAKGFSREEATELANKFSARPEHSEHRTGLCIDFTTNSIGGVVDDVFETTEAFAWLNDNAWKYGFILRYPEDKENVTGYIYESWHYRFVGLDVASIIHQTGLCYEEYLQRFENK